MASYPSEAGPSSNVVEINEWDQASQLKWLKAFQRLSADSLNGTVDALKETAIRPNSKHAGVKLGGSSGGPPVPCRQADLGDKARETLALNDNPQIAATEDAAVS